ncbi:MAG: hypothetical protein EOO41_04820, partial [Methanobacteriota archaeon]
MPRAAVASHTGASSPLERSSVHSLGAGGSVEGSTLSHTVTLNENLTGALSNLCSLSRDALAVLLLQPTDTGHGQDHAREMQQACAAVIGEEAAAGASPFVLAPAAHACTAGARSVPIALDFMIATLQVPPPNPLWSKAPLPISRLSWQWLACLRSDEELDGSRAHGGARGVPRDHELLAAQLTPQLVTLHLTAYWLSRAFAYDHNTPLLDCLDGVAVCMPQALGRALALGASTPAQLHDAWRVITRAAGTATVLLDPCPSVTYASMPHTQRQHAASLSHNLRDLWCPTTVALTEPSTAGSGGAAAGASAVQHLLPPSHVRHRYADVPQQDLLYFGAFDVRSVLPTCMQPDALLGIDRVLLTAGQQQRWMQWSKICSLRMDIA